MHTTVCESSRSKSQHHTLSSTSLCSIRGDQYCYFGHSEEVVICFCWLFRTLNDETSMCRNTFFHLCRWPMLVCGLRSPVPDASSVCLVSCHTCDNSCLSVMHFHLANIVIGYYNLDVCALLMYCLMARTALSLSLGLISGSDFQHF